MSDVVFKLTDAEDCTHGSTQWGPGVTHTAPGGGELCTEAYIHAYSDPLLAVFMDPIHGCFGASAHLWRCDAEGEHKTDLGLKEGYTSVTTIERIDLPVVTNEQRVRFAILCAMGVTKDPFWRDWAQDWLDGYGHSAAAAWEAQIAVDVADVAGRAARAAAQIAADAAQRTAAWGAQTAQTAQTAARVRPLDLSALARKAMQEGR